MPDIERKLTPESVIGTDRKRPPEGETVWLYRLAGVATGYKVGTSTYGDWCQLTGRFEAFRFDNGEVSVANSCHVPCDLDKTIADQISAMKNTEGFQGITFVYDIGIVADPRDKGQNGNPPTKYKYVIRNPDDTERKETQLLRAFPLPPGVKALPSGNSQ